MPVNSTVRKQSRQVSVIHAKGYVAEWRSLDGDRAAQDDFEARLVDAAENGDRTSESAYRMIRALKGEALDLTVAQVRTYQYMARHAHGKPVRVTSHALAQLTQAWLDNHRMCGGEG